MKEINILQNSLKDYFTPQILKLLLYPLLGSIIVLYISFFSVASFGLDSLEQAQLEIQTHQQNIENGVVDETYTKETYTGSAILDFMLKHTVTSWIVSFLVYTIGLFAIGYLSIFISILIIGFLTPKILSIIHQRHYNDLEVNGYGTITQGVFTLLKNAFFMIIILIILFPLYFIPGINLIAINIPFFYFFHKMLHFDVGSTITTKEEFGRIYFKNKTNMRLRSLFLYVISLIPFMAFFISVFYIVYLGHAYFEKKKELV